MRKYGRIGADDLRRGLEALDESMADEFKAEESMADENNSMAHGIRKLRNIEI